MHLPASRVKPAYLRGLLCRSEDRAQVGQSPARRQSYGQCEDLCGRSFIEGLPIETMASASEWTGGELFGA
jgi:hypothetical protein